MASTKIKIDKTKETSFWGLVFDSARKLTFVFGLVAIALLLTGCDSSAQSQQQATATSRVEIASYKQMSDEDLSYPGKNRRSFRFTIDKASSNEVIEATSNVIIKEMKSKYPNTELTIWFFSDEKLVGKIGYNVAMVIYDSEKQDTKVTFASDEEKRLGEMYLSQ